MLMSRFATHSRINVNDTCRKLTTRDRMLIFQENGLITWQTNVVADSMALLQNCECWNDMQFENVHFATLFTWNYCPKSKQLSYWETKRLQRCSTVVFILNGKMTSNWNLVAVLQRPGAFPKNTVWVWRTEDPTDCADSHLSPQKNCRTGGANLFRS